MNLRKNKYGTPVVAVSEHAASILDSAWQEAFEDLDDEWKLKDEMKEALHKSRWLQTELQDKGLQQLLKKIVSTSRNTSFQDTSVTEQEQVLQQIKESNPAFAAFLDKAMVTAGILERQGRDANAPVEEWLQNTHDGPLNVSLKPLPRRQQMYTAIDRNNIGRQGKDDSNEEETTTSSEDDSEDDSSNGDDDEESASGESSASVEWTNYGYSI